MNEQLNRLKVIESRAREIANGIDVNDVERKKQYSELSQLANEIGGVINAVESPTKKPGRWKVSL